MDPNERVVKVKPYPFPITLHSGVQPSQAEVLRLAQHGAVVKLSTQLLMVGTEFLVEFETPVLKQEFKILCKVIKTYDRASVSGPPERLAEIHFKGIDSNVTKQIYKFLVTIRQVGQ